MISVHVHYKCLSLYDSCVLTHVVKEIKLLDITFAAGVEKLDKEEREVNIAIWLTTVVLCHHNYNNYYAFFIFLAIPDYTLGILIIVLNLKFCFPPAVFLLSVPTRVLPPSEEAADSRAQEKWEAEPS